MGIGNLILLQSPLESVAEEKIETNNKFCADCKTTKTPLWRGGPSGPKREFLVHGLPVVFLNCRFPP
ncbi:hypothetical protein EUGRSUZ_B02079 [Eucalyptus grandis]|uniref:Uncharacterized protein n=2 Tax=Eucalyptus grandis TaxID=71139 RepID=A0ACC3LT67_EUCGR|nr:hypothetical protein EUGRSUZ_B02079 [Eucalyptus grandis]